MVRVPSAAGPTLPETGASSIRTPRRTACSARRRETAGAMVLMSTTIRPSRAPSSTPSGPVSTASLAWESATMRKTTSLDAATARGKSAHRAPSAIKGSTFPQVRL